MEHSTEMSVPIHKMTTQTSVNIICRFILKCNQIYKNLNKLQYKKICINYYSINSFDLSVRSDNDKINKMRENIIIAIINNIIPIDYYKYSIRWTKTRDEINKYIAKLCLENNIIRYSQKCIHKAGRGNHYDFMLIINDNISFNIEFKFNAQDIDDAPQFVSPMKPSQYLQTSYEEYYYDNYLPILGKEYNLSLPEKNEFIQKIHTNKPKCMMEFQTKYYNGCKTSRQYNGIQEDINFYNRAKEISYESIKSFIINNELKIDKLNEHLSKSQSNKMYMLYKNGVFHLQTINCNNYKIVSYKKEPNLNRYIATTETGITLKILLRWKNGPGIAFPAFQIS